MRLFFILLLMFLHNAYSASANDTFTYQGQTLDLLRKSSIAT
jgi:hypothetical protein